MLRIEPRPLNQTLLERYGISPGEQRVLGMLVRGATNREIAACLVISVKTVEAHMASILRKTDLHGRGGVIVLFATPWAPTYVPVSADDLVGCF